VKQAYQDGTISAAEHEVDPAQRKLSGVIDKLSSGGGGVRSAAALSNEQLRKQHNLSPDEAAQVQQMLKQHPDMQPKPEEGGTIDSPLHAKLRNETLQHVPPERQGEFHKQFNEMKRKHEAGELSDDQLKRHTADAISYLKGQTGKHSAPNAVKAAAENPHAKAAKAPGNTPKPSAAKPQQGDVKHTAGLIEQAGFSKHDPNEKSQHHLYVPTKGGIPMDVLHKQLTSAGFQYGGAPRKDFAGIHGHWYVRPGGAYKTDEVVSLDSSDGGKTVRSLHHKHPIADLS
jgi:hypothetical protein